MKTISPAALTLALAVVFVSFNPLHAERRADSFLREADAASQAFDNAQYHGAVSAVERFLAPNFLYVRGSGRVAGAREFIANFNDPGQHLDPFVITDRRVIALSRDAVMVSAEGIIHGTVGGKSFAEHFRYADVFVRHSNRWQVVYVQVTPVAS